MVSHIVLALAPLSYISGMSAGVSHIGRVSVH